MSDEAMPSVHGEPSAATPILPAHIEDTIAAIAKLHADHRLQAGTLQRLVDRLTAWVGRPGFIGGMTAIILLWVAGNTIATLAGVQPWDEAPFAWLQGAIGLLAFYVTVLILTTQRREDQLAGYREQLTLELAILSEAKSAKIIALLEEMRRDSPMLITRVDEEAAAMSIAADPQAVLDAIKESEAAPLAAELMTTADPQMDPLTVDRVRADDEGKLESVEAHVPSKAAAGLERPEIQTE